ncbi:hypothetical protein IIA79_01570 [bacterium]|nr:hypothetical protein [bacterium]
MNGGGVPALWAVIAEFPLFVLRLFVHPRSLVRSMDWDDPAARQRIALYTIIWLAILLFAFSDNRVLSTESRPRLSTYKAVVMRAHDRSWDWMSTVYAPINVSQGEAKRLWDTMLTSGFLAYVFLASLIALAVVVRLRMARFGLGWHHALGTGILGYLALVSCIALSLVPLTLLFICRVCWVRLTLYILLNFAAWAYLGYYTLGDLGERPAGWLKMLARSLAWGLAQYVVACLVFFVLMICILPL